MRKIVKKAKNGVKTEKSNVTSGKVVKLWKMLNKLKNFKKKIKNWNLKNIRIRKWRYNFYSQSFKISKSIEKIDWNQK